jgi:hypothetical protein
MKIGYLKNISLIIFLIFTLTACKRMVESNDGGYVIVEDFSFSPTTVILDKNLDATLANTKTYNIEFQPAIQYFLIDIRGKDLHQSRKEAEEKLLQILDITEKEACRLKLKLFVLYSVNKQASEVDNYKLSFCDGALPLQPETTPPPV